MICQASLTSQVDKTCPTNPRSSKNLAMCLMLKPRFVAAQSAEREQKHWLNSSQASHLNVPSNKIQASEASLRACFVPCGGLGAYNFYCLVSSSASSACSAVLSISSSATKGSSPVVAGSSTLCGSSPPLSEVMKTSPIGRSSGRLPLIFSAATSSYTSP